VSTIRTVSPRFITFEGIDGAGKSTHIPFVQQLLEQRGHIVWTTREPGGTELGERLRELLLREPMAPLTEALLMFAARREHCEREIWPRLRQRRMSVLCDRFSDATYAYQGGGHEVPANLLQSIETAALGEFRPDLTILFDVPVTLGLERLANGRTLDRFERQKAEFFERVSGVYRARAAADPTRFRIVDSSQALPHTRQALESIVNAL
jgi:dTMP kinase